MPRKEGSIKSRFLAVISSDGCTGKADQFWPPWQKTKNVQISLHLQKCFRFFIPVYYLRAIFFLGVVVHKCR